jgi:hypothetical protein
VFSEQNIDKLYARNGLEAYDLADRGYVARIHPLQLWLAAYLQNKPDATWADVVKDSAEERQAVYRWLFRTRHKGAKDSRIYTMLELEAFVDIHRRWARVGYPSATWCPRSPPRWAAPATARRRWPS